MDGLVVFFAFALSLPPPRRLGRIGFETGDGLRSET